MASSSSGAYSVEEYARGFEELVPRSFDYNIRPFRFLNAERLLEAEPPAPSGKKAKQDKAEIFSESDNEEELERDVTEIDAAEEIQLYADKNFEATFERHQVDALLKNRVRHDIIFNSLLVSGGNLTFLLLLLRICTIRLIHLKHLALSKFLYTQ